jgi:putative tryptophan/tyrosine transport system substrate-binding protein
VDRRAFVAGTLALLAAPLAAEAQPPAKMPLVGYISPGSSSDPVRLRRLEAFRQGLRELGYVEGQNIAIESLWAEGKDDRLPGLAAELVRLKVDVIVTGGATAIGAAKQATTTIPIVMAAVGDPVRTGLVASLARPGGNITGLTTLGAELSAKRLELLKEAVPKLRRVAFLWNPANPANRVQFEDVQLGAKALHVTLQSVEIRSPDGFDGAFTAITRERPNALIMTADPLHQLNVGRVIEFAARSRLPAMYQLREHVEAGGLMSYGVSLLDLYRRAATLVDKILKGAKPAELPIEQPTKFELVINLGSAKALGLTIPLSVLARADEIIQ